ncbi:MAG: MFS transporter, partial [Halobacteriales archaeon]|nr:MFS transporter [Halobacteriales archaeon]
VAIVTGGHFLSHFYVMTFPPLFPLLVPAFDLNNTQLGLIMSAVALGTFLQVPAGALVRRVGAKRVLALGLGLTGFAIVLVGLAPSYPVLVLFALLSGVGQSAFHPADYALLDAANAGRDAGKSFGVHTFGGFVGFAAAPVIVGTIGFTAGWRTAAILVGVIGVVAAVVIWLVLDTVFLNRMDALDLGHRPTSFREAARGLFSPGIAILFAFFLALVMAGKGLQTFAGVIVVEFFALPGGTGNTVLTVLFALVAVGVLIGGVLADRFNPRRIIVLTMLTAALAVSIAALASFVRGQVAVIGFFAFLGLVYGIPLPSRDRLVADFSSADSVGVNFGIVFTGGSIGSLLSPAILGAVLDAGSAQLAFVLIGLFFAVAGAIVVAVGSGLIAKDVGPTQTPADQS